MVLVHVGITGCAGGGDLPGLTRRIHSSVTDGDALFLRYL